MLKYFKRYQILKVGVTHPLRINMGKPGLSQWKKSICTYFGCNLFVAWYYEHMFITACKINIYYGGDFFEDETVF